MLQTVITDVGAGDVRQPEPRAFGDRRQAVVGNTAAVQSQQIQAGELMQIDQSGVGNVAVVVE